MVISQAAKLKRGSLYRSNHFNEPNRATEMSVIAILLSEVVSLGVKKKNQTSLQNLIKENQSNVIAKMVLQNLFSFLIKVYIKLFRIQTYCYLKF